MGDRSTSGAETVDPAKLTPSLYRTIVADPPWKYDGFLPGYSPSSGEQFAAAQPYSMMSLSEIASLPVNELADADCRLWLWTTNRYLGDAFDILQGWGFRYRQTIVWHKTGRVPPFGGHIAPNHGEYLLVGVKGKPGTGDRWRSSVVAIPRLAHSQKPEAFLDWIEASSPGPYLEMFARRARFGWDYWGDQSLGTAKLTPPTEQAA